jgi:hypothetical protein
MSHHIPCLAPEEHIMYQLLHYTSTYFELIFFFMDIFVYLITNQKFNKYLPPEY